MVIGAPFRLWRRVVVGRIVRSWERVARSTEPAYSKDKVGVGIGPIDGQAIGVTEMDYESGHMRAVSPDGRIVLKCESSGISVHSPDPEPDAPSDSSGMYEHER